MQCRILETMENASFFQMSRVCCTTSLTDLILIKIWHFSFVTSRDSKCQVFVEDSFENKYDEI